jgi:TonB family protein
MTNSLDGSLFSLLPEKRPPWKQFVFSSCLQAAGILCVVIAGLLNPDVLVLTSHYQFTRLVDPTPYVSHERAHASLRIAEKITSLPKETKAPVLVVRRELKPKPRLDPIEAPQVRMTASQLALPASSTLAPRLLVKTDPATTGSSKAPTVVRPPQLVQTGGFGDPNGVPAKANSMPVNIAQLGAFDLPTGEGKGNGSGGRNGTPGVVASAGFGNGIATGDASTGAAHAGGVKQAGFGDASVAAPKQTGSVSSLARDIVPAEILSKPNPLYTEEARKLHIEGEVLLQVVFQPSGTIEVLQVVRGLGHGLDEAAIDAAQHIRFKPAMREGKPAASTGVLHVVFQLA